MEIRFSKYNSPFCEAPEPGVHYISKDDQFAMRTGHYDSHVASYFATFSHNHLRLDCYSSRVKDDYVPFTPDEVDYLQTLYFEHGVKAAAASLANHFKETN